MSAFIRASVPRTDRRLLGTWKSDSRQTMKEWTWTKRPSVAKRRKLRAIFGKLEITYTRTKIISKLRNWETWRSYAVLGTDETSVAIRVLGDLRIKNAQRYDPVYLDLLKEHWSNSEIWHIHFARNCYWISLGKNREFFRRLRNDG